LAHEHRSPAPTCVRSPVPPGRRSSRPAALCASDPGAVPVCDASVVPRPRALHVCDALPAVRLGCTLYPELTSQSECFPEEWRRRLVVTLPTQQSSWSTGEIEDFRDLARTFCQKELTPHQDRWIEQKQVDRELWTKAGGVGLLALSVPEEYGGGGGTFAHEAVLYEEQARAGDSCWGVSVHSGIVAHYLVNYGNEQQKHD